MSKTIRVNVTQRDIDRGEPGNEYACPVARAILRHRELRLAAVNCAWVWIWNDSHRKVSWRTRTPPNVRTFIRHFDAGKPVSMFSFDLEVPE